MIYLDLWKRCFDYKGSSNRKEFWVPFVIHAGITVLALICMVIVFVSAEMNSVIPAKIFVILGWILNAYLLAGIVPFISLTVRRLHDTGRSGWWYFLVFGFGVGALLLLFLLSAGSTSYNNFVNNEPVAVYGPPIEDPYFDPSTNEPDEVYGPPADYEDTEEPFVPNTNEPILVYGPPEDFE